MVTFLSAQDKLRHVETLGPNEGLTSRHIHFISQSTTGHIFFSSTKGVFIFDGNNKLQQILPGENECQGMIDPNVQSGFFEANGKIWFATYRGINYLDQVSGCITGIQLVDSCSRTIKEGYHIFHIEHDSTLWLKAGSDIFSYHIHTEKLLYIAATHSVRFDVETGPNNEVLRIVGCPWLNALGYEIYNKEGEQWHHRVYHTLSTGKKDYQVQVIEALSVNETLFFATQNGLFSQQKGSDIFERHSLPDQDSSYLNALCQLDDSTLLVGSKLTGAWQYHISNHNFTKYEYHHTETTPDQPIPYGTLEIAKGRDETIWISDAYTARVHYGVNLPANSLTKLDIEASIHQITSTAPTNLFALTTTGEVLHFERSCGGKALPISTASGQYPRCRAIASDHQSRLWIVANEFIVCNDGNDEDQVYRTRIGPLYDPVRLHPLHSGVIVHANNTILFAETRHSSIECTVIDVPGIETPEEITSIYTLGQRVLISKGASELFEFEFLNYKLAHALTTEITFTIYDYEMVQDILKLATDTGIKSYKFGEGIVGESAFNRTAFWGGPTIKDPPLMGIAQTQNNVWAVLEDALLIQDLRSIKGLRYVPFDRALDIGYTNVASTYSDTQCNKVFFGTTRGLIELNADSVFTYDYPPKLYVKKILLDGIEVNRDIHSLRRLKASTQVIEL